MALPHRLLQNPNGIEIRDWKITDRKLHILDSVELDQ